MWEQVTPSEHKVFTETFEEGWGEGVNAGLSIVAVSGGLGLLYGLLVGVITQNMPLLLLGEHIVLLAAALGLSVAVACGVIDVFSTYRVQGRARAWVARAYPDMFTPQQVKLVVDWSVAYVNDNGRTRDRVKMIRNPAGVGRVLTFQQVPSQRLRLIVAPV